MANWKRHLFTVCALLCVVNIVQPNAAHTTKDITVSQMSPLFDKDGQVSKPLQKLLSATGISLDAKPNDESVSNYILRRTQAEWLRRPDQERWHLDQNIAHNHDTILEQLSQLGFTQEIIPERKSYDAVAVLGAAGPSMYNRLKHALSLIEDGTIRTSKVVILVGDRPRNEERESRTELEKCCDTPLHKDEQLPTNEIEIAKCIVNHTNIPNNISVEYVETPQHTDGKRPNTRDTLLQWNTTRPASIQSVVLVSHQPFVRYQHAIAENALPNNMHYETIGSANNIATTPTAVLLDTVARWIYAHVNKQ